MTPPQRPRDPNQLAKINLLTWPKIPESRSAEMRKITFAVYSPPKEGLPYLSAVIAPTGAVAAVAYQTAAEAEDHNLKLAMETARGVE